MGKSAGRDKKKQASAFDKGKKAPEPAPAPAPAKQSEPAKGSKPSRGK